MPPRPWWEQRWFLALALLLTALPLLWPQVPPLTDLPGDMGRYQAMLGADGGTLSAWHVFQWKPMGGVGVDLLVAALAPLIGLEPAVKLIVIAIPVMTASGMVWLNREAHGRVQPVVLFALPYAYNLAFLRGSLNSTLAMAMALNAFALWLRLARPGGARLRAAIFVPLGAMVWTAHPLGWLCLGVMAFAAETVRQRAAGRGWPSACCHAALACLPLAPPALMLLAWRPDAPASNDWLESLRLKPGWLVMALRDRWIVFDVASTIVIALLLRRSFRDRRVIPAPMLVAAAIGLLILFTAMPSGPDMLIAPYAIILGLLAIRLGTKMKPRERRMIALAGLAFFLARTAATTTSFALESADWNRHLAALDHVPRGSRVAAFVVDGCDQPWRMPRTGPLPDMAIVRRAAFANDPAQVVTDQPCPESPDVRDLDTALASLPHERFDMLWLITPARLDAGRLRGLRPIWSDGRDFLFAIPHPRLSPPASAR